jgi:hypothetical protein
MKSRGTGLRKSGAGACDVTAPLGATWADFMAEEVLQALLLVVVPATAGVGWLLLAVELLLLHQLLHLLSLPSASDADSKTKSVSQVSPAPGSVYELPPLVVLGNRARPKTQGTAGERTGGVLLQAGTLDSAAVGRTKVKLEPYHFIGATKILPNVHITRSLPRAMSYSITLDSTSRAWCWDAQQQGWVRPFQPVVCRSGTREVKWSWRRWKIAHVIILGERIRLCGGCQQNG